MHRVDGHKGSSADPQVLPVAFSAIIVVHDTVAEQNACLNQGPSNRPYGTKNPQQNSKKIPVNSTSVPVLLPTKRPQKLLCRANHHVLRCTSTHEDFDTGDHFRSEAPSENNKATAWWLDLQRGYSRRVLRFPGLLTPIANSPARVSSSALAGITDFMTLPDGHRSRMFARVRVYQRLRPFHNAQNAGRCI